MDTYIVLVLDESGSMESIKNDIVKGLNKYIDDLKAQNIPMGFTLNKFNSLHVSYPYLNTPIAEVQHFTNLDYSPSGNTPLYDAIGNSISELTEKLEMAKKYLGNTPPILFITMTDGMENFSKEHTREGILSLIKSKEKEGWSFVYLGANQDAWAVGGTFGMNVGNTSTYTPDAVGVADAYALASTATLTHLNTNVQHFKATGISQSSTNLLSKNDQPQPPVKKAKKNTAWKKM